MKSIPSPMFFRAGRFSQRAAESAAWIINGRKPKGDLLWYLLYDQPLPAAKKPTSSLYPELASFWEDNSSSQSIMGALWNPRTADGHQHPDVNSIHLTAYGEPILSNSGYAGWGNGYGGFSWDYIHNQAVAGNVVMIDGVNHARTIGNGIPEGFTNLSLDYASGDSGSALPNGRHLRNFIFVHPQDGRGGDFVLFDEVTRSGSGVNANLVLHPTSAIYSEVTAKQEYRWTIRRVGTSDVFLTAFLATPPATNEIRNGALANTLVGKYLYASYPFSGATGKNIVTVLFPSDATHPKANMSRLAGTGYTGAKVDLGAGVQDFALESNGLSVPTLGNISFQARAALYRTSGTNLLSYFVRKGKSFNDTLSSKGFESDNEVTVFQRGMQGTVIASAVSKVTFRQPGITDVWLNGIQATRLASGSGWVSVQVPSGTNQLELKISTTPTPTPTSSPLVTISQAGWTLHYVDSQQTGGYEAAKSFDGNSGTIWHSGYLPAPADPLPHEIQINLNGIYAVGGFRYLPRQDGGSNGRIGQYEFYLSNDGSSWGSSVVSGTFANDATEKERTFTGATARYVRLRALTDAAGSASFTSMAELNVLGSLISIPTPTPTLTPPPTPSPTPTPTPTTCTGNYYVSTTGADTNSGTAASPFRTITKAADSVAAGQTVCVRAGTYNEEVKMKTSGTSSARITFVGENAQTTIVDAGARFTGDWTQVS